MHFEHIFWGVLVCCHPTPNITLYLELRSELDCGTGASMAKLQGLLLLLREVSPSPSIAYVGNQQPHEEGGKRKLLHHIAQV